jgi:ADP-ribose pyrophosphatase YjhB (NUDIX family)
MPLNWPPPKRAPPPSRLLRQIWVTLGQPVWLGELLVRVSLPRYIIGALGLVWDEQDRVLLVRQRYRTPGWALPGGGVHIGESLEACLRREIAEELGWEVDVGPAVGCIGGARRHWPLGYADVGFVCYRRAGEFRPSAEIAEIGYFAVDQALQRVGAGLRPLIEAAASQPYESRRRAPSLTAGGTHR